MSADGCRRPPARSPVVAFAAAALTLLLAPRALLPARPAPPGLRPGLRGAARGAAPRGAGAGAGGAGGGALLGELARLAGSLGEEELAARVDADFARLAPEDLSALQERLAAAGAEDAAQLQLLSKCIQASMERRMEQAKRDIDALLMSSGDIDQNIRDCLDRQDSPLPIMTVLQINIAKAKRDGLQKQEQALVFIFAKLNAELEQQVPIANRVLTRLLSIGERNDRRDFLQAHLAQAPSEKVATPDDLAQAIVQLVADVEDRFGSGGAGFGGETREGTLVLIRQVALDAGVVVGEVRGEDEQAAFTEQLLPLFEALSK